MEEFHKLQRLERQLAARYNLMDPVDVFEEARARACTKRTPQSEQDLRQMSKLRMLVKRHSARTKRSRMISTAGQVGFYSIFLTIKTNVD